MKHSEAHLRVLNRINKTETGCWEFTGCRDGGGYGTVQVGLKRLGTRKMNKTHRVIYRHYFGDIPEGHQVLHRCDNPPCVNPDHLWTGTRKDNIHDAINKGRWKNPTPRLGEKNPMAKFTEKQVKKILQLLVKGITQEEIGRRFGTDQSHISAIKRGRLWKHLQSPKIM